VKSNVQLWRWGAAALALLVLIGGVVGWKLTQGVSVQRPLADLPTPTTEPLAPAPTPVPATATTVAPAVAATVIPVTPAATPVATPAPLPTRVIPPAEPLQLPDGFGISVFATGLANPRMMTLDPDGALVVVERGRQRVVRLPDDDVDGVADNVVVLAEGGLEAPSSAAFFPDGALYVGDVRQVVRFFEPNAAGAFQRREVVISGLPDRQGHSTRTVLFSPDFETLYVSIGSSCNVCREQDSRRATIMRYDPDGSNGRVWARGLRNAVGLAIRPGTSELWVTNNGRDGLGDDLPPETIYHLQEGDDAGWPYCHAGRIVDPDLGAPGACEGVLKPVIELQAHSAPIGLTFYTGARFPEAYWGDLFVVFRGSWNRSEPTGYKLVHIPLAEDGAPGSVQDFVSGWLRADGTNWGRPADVITGSDGSLYVSEDQGGVIYRIFYESE